MKKQDLWKAYAGFCCGMIFSSVLVNVGEKIYSTKVNKSNSNISIEYEKTGVIELFEPGEHAVIEKVKSQLDKVTQYPSHPGYKPIGIATSAYGSLSQKDGDTCIMYINTEVVQANANVKIGEDYYFGGFGVPVNYEKNISEETEIVEFAPGEHILSVPIDSAIKYDINYEYHEGYEPVGIAESSYGDSYNTSAEAVVLYVNVDEVECKRTEDNDYTEFGKVKEKEKIKEIK